MTVRYTLDVSTTKFSSFARLLLRWRGSLWKSIYKDLLVWLFFYFLLSAIYRYALEDEQKEIFGNVTYYCYKNTDFIPLTFILGFFVNLVVRRWWEMLKNIGWVDNTSLYIAVYLEGTDDKARMIRRNIVRYMVLVQAMVFRDISVPIRRRFPTLETLQVAGFMSKEEMKKLTAVPTKHSRYWIPMQWAMMLVKQARREGLITDDFAVQELITRLREYRSALGTLLCYDWVPVPLVYTQVVGLTVRCYFLICLMGRQFVTETPHDAVNSPAALTIVDYTEDRQPTLEKDVFWSEPFPEPLYSAESLNCSNINPYVGSATEMHLSKESDVIMMPRMHEESNDVGEKEKPARKPMVVRSLSTISRTQRDPGSYTQSMKRRVSLMSNHVRGHLQRQKTVSSVTIENGELPLSPEFISDSLSDYNSVFKDSAPMTISVTDALEKDKLDSLPNSPTTNCGEKEMGSLQKISISQLHQLSFDKQPMARLILTELADVAEEDDVFAEQNVQPNQYENVIINKLTNCA
uniref:Bestrophin homolog n=1 Tax=Plectus sambesii TaxID=2011161 RepID=A0A914W7C9_9BILA